MPPKTSDGQRPSLAQVRNLLGHGSNKQTRQFLEEEPIWGLFEEFYHDFYKDTRADGQRKWRGPGSLEVIQAVKMSIDDNDRKYSPRRVNKDGWEKKDHYARFIFCLIDELQKPGSPWSIKKPSTEDMYTAGYRILQLIVCDIGESNRGKTHIGKAYAKMWRTEDAVDDQGDEMADGQGDDVADGQGKRELEGIPGSDDDDSSSCSGPDEIPILRTGSTTWHFPGGKSVNFEGFSLKYSKSNESALLDDVKAPTSSVTVTDSETHALRDPKRREAHITKLRSRFSAATAHSYNRLISYSPKESLCNRTGGKAGVGTGIEALFPGTCAEIRKFNEIGRRQERNSEKAPRLTVAHDDLRTKRGSGPSWLPGMNSETTLYPIQIQGVSWVKNMLCPRRGTDMNHTPAAMLADECGVGKTIQAIGTIATKVTHHKWGAKKPTIVICPKILAPMWYRELTKRLPKSHKIVFYAADVKNRMAVKTTLKRKDIEGQDYKYILLTTYTTFEARNGVDAQNSWVGARKGRSMTDKDSLNLGGLFELLILDEARMVKNPETKRFKAVELLKAKEILFLTGTPLENRTEDLHGILALIPGINEIWQRITSDGKRVVDPYKLADGDDDSVLQLSPQAFKKVLERTTDAQKMGVVIRKISDKLSLRRTFFSDVQGQPLVPPMTTRVMFLRHCQSRQREMETMHAEFREGLFYNGAEKGVMVVWSKFRNLVQSTAWLPLGRMGDWMQEHYKPFFSNNKTLEDMLLAMFERFGDVMGFDPTDKNLDLVAEVVGQSPKLQAVSLVVAHVVHILQTKVIIWTMFPAEQALVAKVLQAAGIYVDVCHASLSDSQRETLIHRFKNDENTAQVLVMGYKIGSVGLNLEDLCYHTIVFTPAMSQPGEVQAVFRVRRLLQKFEQIVILLQLNGSMDIWLRANQMKKALPDLFSRLNEADGHTKVTSQMSLRELNSLWKVWTGFKTVDDAVFVDDEDLAGDDV